MKLRVLSWSFGLYLLWIGATYLLEGRVTLLRPDATEARFTYIIVANLLIGAVGAAWTLRALRRDPGFDLDRAGFGPIRRMAVFLPVGFLLGGAIYLLQGSPSRDLTVVLNAFCQTLPVSVAEVLVCWSVIFASTEAALHSRGQVLDLAGGVVIASALFGLYHFAHSPPFNTIPMVLLLTGIGVVTSIFFLLTREVYGTIVFHNFFAAFGVLQALEVEGRLAAFAEPRPDLYLGAGAVAATVILLDMGWLRSRGS